ncbi:MAG: hypothetical protein KBH08_06890 [Brachymonas sp.]|nr:hypothetical protein [Brachymonas sp.]MBP8794754.1 hypothetical protein [Brachymonas sp.]MBP8821812.1 hypothetical protein [Brachymonas sp.]MBP9651680.1 hypothetical protein [Brachymonas sp.]
MADGPHPSANHHLFSLHAKQTGSHTVTLWVQDWQGRRAMEATATRQPE